MSALSVFKPAEPQGQAEPLSAAALLGAATKKPTKGTSHLTYTGTDIEAAARWLVLGRQAEEIKRELALLRDAILGVVSPGTRRPVPAAAPTNRPWKSPRPPARSASPSTTATARSRSTARPSCRPRPAAISTASSSGPWR